MSKDKFNKILIWLKVNNLALIEYSNNDDSDYKHFDFLTDKFYTKKEIIQRAKEFGYND